MLDKNYDISLNKALFILSIIAGIAVAYLKATPKNPTTFILIFIILSAPAILSVWKNRGRLLQLNRYHKIFYSLLLLGGLILSIYWYNKIYDNHIYYLNGDKKEILYFPIRTGERLASKLDRVDGDLGRLVDRYGFDMIKEAISEESNKNDFFLTEAYFMIIALVGFICLLFIAMFIYLEAWSTKLLDAKPELITLRKQVLKYIGDDRLEESFSTLLQSDLVSSLYFEKSIALLKGQYEDLEHKFNLNLLSHQEYTIRKSKLKWALLNLIS